MVHFKTPGWMKFPKIENPLLKNDTHKISSETHAPVNSTVTEEPFDDLGLNAPGTRNISINHQFLYYNYTEISLLHSNQSYRFEKSGEHEQSPEEADELQQQRDDYWKKRNKGRPG